MSNVPGDSNTLSSPDLDAGNNGALPSRISSPLWALPLLGAWAYGVWVYTQLPAQVPVHWDFSGQIDRYGGPAEAAFLLPVMLTLIAGLLLGILPRFIPHTPGYAGTHRAYGQLATLVLTFLLYVEIVISFMFMGRNVPLVGLLTLGAGVMFILMGNLLPKLRRNVIAGARLSWAMHDDVTWVRSQRAAGLAFSILGLVLVCAAPLPGWVPLYVLFGGKALAVAGVVWYSWRVRQPAVGRV